MKNLKWERLLFKLKAEENERAICFSSQYVSGHILSDLVSSGKYFDLGSRSPGDQMRPNGSRCKWIDVAWPDERSKTLMASLGLFSMASYWRKQHVNSYNLRWPLQNAPYQNLLGGKHGFDSNFTIWFKSVSESFDSDLTQGSQWLSKNWFQSTHDSKWLSGILFDSTHDSQNWNIDSS